jgi:hypothetical protein
MKVEDVLADEVIELGGRIRPPVLVEIEPLAVAEILERAHVADRRVEPDVEILAGRVGDLEAEVRCESREMSQSVSLFSPTLAQPLLQLVGRFVLQPPFALRPAAQKGLAARIGKPEEKVLGLPQLGPGAGNRRIGVFQLVGRVRRTAALAVVTVLVGRTALRAFALDEAIGQEHLLERVVILLDGARLDQPAACRRA